MKQIKMLLLASMVMLFTACGGGSSSTSNVPVVDDPQTVAIAKIISFADDNTQPIPNIQDYLDAGVVGVTAENIADINDVVASLTGEEVDTREEIQAIADDLELILPDTTPPVITINGVSPTEVTQYDTYSDPGATATDDRDGTTEVIITGSVDTSTVGTFTITYTATDNAGNTATSSRTVNVVLTADTTPPDASVAETSFITISAKQYIPVGKEMTLYNENIAKRYRDYPSRVSISFTGGEVTSLSTKITPLSVGTIEGTANILNEDYGTFLSKSFDIIVSDPTVTTAVNIQNIGDSFTGRMTWANVINATPAAENITYSGIRESNAASPQIKCEGRGGWTLNKYFSVDPNDSYNPFMQPITEGYHYYGKTSFWIDANSVTPSYSAGYYNTSKLLFDEVTGLKITPNLHDVMSDGVDSYIEWNGSAWVAIDIATFGNFAFNYGRYRTAWNIPAPTIMNVLLGTNDMYGATEMTFGSKYIDYKAKYDALIASVKADTPAVKITIGIPTSSGRQGEYVTTETEKFKIAYYLLAEALNADYGGREAEGLYLIDYHSNIDRVYGFINNYEESFDFIHLGPDGFTQMGNIYMGIIQHLRKNN